ncbi:hypothetical protein SAMN04490244_108157 [Tranquillimonas rosea]|uniref:AAA+ family ATPase n=2 Tax=Tranquillimonas rosea TaxID=641238 RepID=A0A1H9VW08_9RHOB|nr:AAA+ family ATPase [Tranquillimonas rosea]SES25990.1 hypothetical protein SAMN04490244_108157 [Tranquillimonas rosea]
MLFAAMIATASLTPATAQEGDIEEGASLLERGALMLLRGLMDELQPAMRDMVDALQGLDIDDLSLYHAPEVMPNGDIIIRRREDAPPPESAPENNEIEL